MKDCTDIGIIDNGDSLTFIIPDIVAYILFFLLALQFIKDIVEIVMMLLDYKASELRKELKEKKQRKESNDA